MTNEIEKYEFDIHEKTICDLNTYLDCTVGASGDGGAHYIDFRWWLFLMIGRGCGWQEYNDFRKKRDEFEVAPNVYELIHTYVHNDDTYNIAKHRIQVFEQNVCKNYGYLAGTDHCIFDYDPITGKKIDWKNIINELTTAIWHAKFYDEYKNKDIINKNE